MFLTPRISSPWRGRVAAVLPWVFVLGVAAGVLLNGRGWQPWKKPVEVESPYARDSEIIWQRAGNPSVLHPVDVIRTIDGDTFEARVHLWPGLDLMTRVRLRGIDAPETKAACAEEGRLADAATIALRKLLEEGDVAIYNIGPDKYSGRVVADAGTKRTPNISAALLKSGHVRTYQGGRRSGWCSGSLW